MEHGKETFKIGPWEEGVQNRRNEEYEKKQKGKVRKSQKSKTKGKTKDQRN